MIYQYQSTNQWLHPILSLKIRVFSLFFEGYVGYWFVDGATWIAISEQQQYQEGGVSMYNINSFTDFLNIKGEDCSCFGPTQQLDQHFLAKHKTANTTTHPTSPGDSHSTQNQDHSLKNGYKKSLKRNTTGHNSSVHMVAPQKGLEDSSRWPQEVPLQKWRQETQAPLYYREITEKPRSYGESQEVMGYNRPRLPQVNAGHQLQNKMAVHCPPFIPPQNTGMMSPVRVSFGPAMAGKIVLSPQTATSTKIQPSTHDETASITPQVSVLPLEQVKPKQKSKQLQKCLSLQHIYTDIDHQLELLDAQFSKKCQEIPTSPGKTEGHISKPTDGQKKLTQRMSLNVEIGKSQLLNLKKMDDVLEICSQAGSQESSSSDQSIVVGRLNEYCSMVDQKGGSQIGQKSVQSKGAGMTSISSTISHYQFNRRKDQS